MKISAPTAKLFVEQLHHELSASYSYLGMAAYFDAQDLPGFASWFRAQSDEERMHAMKLYDFIVDAGAEVALPPLEAPSLKFQSPKAVIEAGLAQEQTVTAQIKAIYRSAIEEGDYLAQPLLHWFLEEQMEEETSFEDLLVRVAAVETGFDLLTVDAELAGRSAGAEE